MSTLLEPFQVDTQMDYSGDHDVAMHGAGSSDPWPFPGESITMDQDGNHDETASVFTHRDESVEVDMADEEEYTDHPEYEMVDGDDELLDVEVYDAAVGEPSPAATMHDAPQLSGIHSVDYMFESAPSLPDVAIAEAHVSTESHTHAHTDLQSHNFDDPAPVNETFVAEYHSGEVGHEEAQDAPLEPLTAHSEYSTEPSLLPTSEADAHPIQENVATEHFIIEQADAVPSTDVSEHRHEEHAPEQAEHILEYQQALDQEAHGEYHHPEPDAHTYADDQQVQQLQEIHEVQQAQETHERHEIQEQEITNPLEPGFGVDPSPPIHLSFSFEDPEFVLEDVWLFNAPAEEQGEVLLRHHPLLYFATLDEIFAALRADEYTAQIPLLADGEMVLEAHELQLAITEDNAYAREISLHDLEYLHAGCDIAGPLRLRMRIADARFLTRYQALRDQIDRLNVAREASEHPEEAGAAGDAPGEYHEEREHEEVAEYAHHDEEQANAPAPVEAEAALTAPETEADLEGTGDAPDVTQTDQDQDQQNSTAGPATEDISGQYHEGYAPSLERQQVEDEEAPEAGEYGAEPHEHDHLEQQQEQESDDYAEGEGEYDESYGEGTEPDADADVQEDGEEQHQQEDHQVHDSTEHGHEGLGTDYAHEAQANSNELQLPPTEAEEEHVAGGDDQTEITETYEQEHPDAADDAESSHFNNYTGMLSCKT
ncbi:hypothetical protein FIBSPDRAFT_453766 [Athelia psychrophila]|uniref:Uncharacterized protein n=1 Tax=Athelia psychrophila TaxID=1759441 RepID=A0A166M6Y8_9AGAM|nr:hypothetical protein FIBSPDRAFT_453766 [Fibularhizoctonia sp. CBS 109695]